MLIMSWLWVLIFTIQRVLSHRRRWTFHRIQEEVIQCTLCTQENWRPNHNLMWLALFVKLTNLVLRGLIATIGRSWYTLSRLHLYNSLVTNSRLPPLDLCNSCMPFIYSEVSFFSGSFSSKSSNTSFSVMSSQCSAKYTSAYSIQIMINCHWYPYKIILSISRESAMNGSWLQNEIKVHKIPIRPYQQIAYWNVTETIERTCMWNSSKVLLRNTPW